MVYEKKWKKTNPWEFSRGIAKLDFRKKGTEEKVDVGDDELPDRPFHNFEASKSDERWTFFCWETFIDGFCASEVFEKSVGYIVYNWAHTYVLPYNTCGSL